MTEPVFRKLTEDEYLRLLEETEVKYEFVDGFIYAQAGASNSHNLIASNLAYSLYAAAKKKGCRLYQSDMRLRLNNPKTGQLIHYFPDLMVSCESAIHDPQTLNLVAPCLIVEILSRSTFREDQSGKWLAYQTLDSLQTYLMIDSRSRAVAAYQRSEDGWTYRELGQEDSLTLTCPPVTLTLADLYDGTSL